MLTDFEMFSEASLVRLVRRLGLDRAQVVRTRNALVWALPVIAWAPLLILSALSGKLFSGSVKASFLSDLEAHVRLLVALPLLLVAERIVEQRVRIMFPQFLARELVPDQAMERFEAAIVSARRLCGLAVLEILLIALIYSVGIFVIWRKYIALGDPTWYAMPTAGGSELSLAGTWYAYVSLPIFQFIMLRWYLRLLIWTRLLWQVSRVGLRLIPSHPDHLGGLGFVLAATNGFVLLAVAHGALLAGWLATRVVVLGAPLADYKFEIAAMTVFVLCITMGPLLTLTGPLVRGKRQGVRDYGTLASRYVREFDAKWLRGGSDGSEPLVGSPDVQSLADMGNSYEFVSGMRTLPITRDLLLRFAAATLLPVAPLVLTIMPVELLLQRLVGVIL